MPRPVFQIAVRHPGLKTYRVIRGTDWFVVNQKARAQYYEWERIFQDQTAREAAHREKARAEKAREEQAKERAYRESLRRCERWAAEQTAEADAAMRAVRNTLKHTLAVDDLLDWDALVDRSEYSVAPPVRREVPPPDNIAPAVPEPQPDAPAYRPSFNPLDLVMPWRKRAKVEEADRRLEEDRNRWAAAVEHARAQRQAIERKHAAAMQAAEDEYRRAREAWEADRMEFLRQQQERNRELLERKERYRAGEPEAIASYCHMVLARSEYPDTFPRDVDVGYDPSARRLVVDFTLPPLACVPDVRVVTFDAEKHEFSVERVDERQRQALYSDLLYQIPLRTLHELFESERSNAIDEIVFNGRVFRLNPATGNDEAVCVLSVAATRKRFTSLGLGRVNPKACFEALGGRRAPDLVDPVAVTPVASQPEGSALSTSTSSRPSRLYASTNFDMLDWEDFESLIRLLIEKHFASSTSSVRVLRSDPEWGFAAAIPLQNSSAAASVVIARHTNDPVDGAAIDDLVALMAGEEADRGAFITTGEFTSEAMEAANGRSIPLINGTALLELLARGEAPTARHLRDTSELEQETRRLYTDMTTEG